MKLKKHPFEIFTETKAIKIDLNEISSVERAGNATIFIYAKKDKTIFSPVPFEFYKQLLEGTKEGFLLANDDVLVNIIYVISASDDSGDLFINPNFIGYD